MLSHCLVSILYILYFVCDRIDLSKLNIFNMMFYYVVVGET